MARATTKTLLPLDRFAQIAGINPLHFNQITLDPDYNARTCGQPWTQYRWQNAGRFGREELAQVIAEAEDKLASLLHFDVAPRYHQAEMRWPKGGHRAAGGGGLIWTSRGYVFEMGTPKKEIIESEAGISFTSKYNRTPTYEEIATVDVTTVDVTDPNEFAVYYPGENGADEWEIRPIKVTFDEDTPGLVHITFRREQCVLPELQEDFIDARGVDGTKDDNFLSTVDVYRKFTDPSQQGNFVWTCDQCADNSCGACTYSSHSACVSIFHETHGALIPHAATWDPVTKSYSASSCAFPKWSPEKIQIWYKAGWRNHDLTRMNVTMDPMWEQILVHLVLAMIGRPACDCDSVESESRHWVEDLALRESSTAMSKSYHYDADLLQNPLGSSRGEVEAWRRVEQLALSDQPVVG